MVVLGANELRPDESEVTRANPKIFTNTTRVRDRKRLSAEIGKTASHPIFCWELGVKWPGRLPYRGCLRCMSP